MNKTVLDCRALVGRRLIAGWIVVAAISASLIFSYAFPAMTQEAEDEDEAPAEITRTRTEVEALIRAAGQTPPDWWDDVHLNYPPRLDLTWDDSQRGPTRNLGGYMWNNIRPNSRRWQEGAKLMHQTLTVNRDNPDKLKRSMTELGLLFCWMEDYERAAYWWRRAGVVGGEEDPLGLARCYWKLGNREMAGEILARIDTDTSRRGNAIRLIGEMGYIDRAQTVAERSARGNTPDVALLAAGNALRHAGRHEEALSYYRRVAALERGGRDLNRNKQRAQAGVSAMQALMANPPENLANGTYTASAPGYVGEVQVVVMVVGGNIAGVRVSQHRESRPINALSVVPSRIVEKKGIDGVDAVTGATVSSDAVINAAAKAIAESAKAAN